MHSAETKSKPSNVLQRKSDTPFFQAEESREAFFGPETQSETSFFQSAPPSIQAKCDACEQEEQVQRKEELEEQTTPEIQPKLTIGAPDDPYEKQADAVADQVVQRLAQTPSAVGTTSNAVQPKTAEPQEEQIQEKSEDGEQEGERLQMKPIFESTPPPDDAAIQRACASCEEEQNSTVQRKESGGETTASPNLSSRLASSRGSGSPLPADTKTQMEGAMGADFSGVRVHTGSDAADMSQGIHAHAFTHGSDIYFNKGKYDPGSTDGQRLLAHELVHTVQQGGGVRKSIQRTNRDALDPSNTRAWDWFDRRSRRARFRTEFDATLGASTEAALDMENSLRQGTDVPHDQESRDRLDSVFEARMENLVRLNALGLMASHKSSVEFRRDEMLHPERIPPDLRESAQTPEQGLNMIRRAARGLNKLNLAKDRLTSSKSALNGVKIESLNSWCWNMGNCTDAWMQTIYDNIQDYLSDDMRSYHNNRVLTFSRGISSDITRVYFRLWAEELVRWRQRQLNGVIMAINEVYMNFPLFRNLSSETVEHGEELVTNQGLARAAENAYVELLNNIDEAIVLIGSGDISAFDLPEAVNHTRQSLPENVRQEFERILHNHEISQFWTHMGWTAAQIIVAFVPVVGPAIAAGIGVASTASNIESLLDRVTLARFRPSRRCCSTCA